MAIASWRSRLRTVNREKMVLGMLTTVSQMAFVILALVFAAAAGSPPPSLALPSCPDTCGNLTDIPYPFGVGPGCFRDPWYEIDCQRTLNIFTPVLKKLNVVVLNITLPYSRYRYRGLINISQPILYSHPNCMANQGAPVDLRASKGIFRYSQSENYLVAGGCDSLALMIASDTPWRVVGCKSFCSNGTLGYDQCSNGTGCCMTSIPGAIAKYSVDFKTLNGEAVAPADAECRYAFLVDSTWWSYQGDLHGPPQNVPVVLEWAIADYDDEPRWNWKNRGWDQKSSSCSRIIRPGFPVLTYCSCSQGYKGNPYLPQGCQDVDECKEYPDLNCRGKCVNRSGSFDCIDNKIIVMIGMGTSVGAIILLLLSWLSYKFIKRRRETKLKQKFFKRNGGLLLQQRLSSIEDSHMEKGNLFTSMQLDTATDRFNENRILGQGGQGTVYKGMLTDGTIIAVKKSIAVDEGQVVQFVNEVAILSEINHRNVVRLLGFCLESEVPLLVYEFVPNGTLYQYLHDPDRELPVSWETRLRIANEVAAALSYLHFAAAIPVYHRDIKSSNILLDEKSRAKVADFGASRSITIDQTHLTTMVQGTFGYLDPEYFQTSQLTDKSDVYSFGVVLVELLTGEKPISQLRAEEDRNLATYFIISMEQNRLFDVLDKEVLDHGEKEEIIAVSNLARRCLNFNGRYRPAMREVALELERARSMRNPPVVQEIDGVGIGRISASAAISALMPSEEEVEPPSAAEDRSLLRRR